MVEHAANDRFNSLVRSVLETSDHADLPSNTNIDAKRPEQAGKEVYLTAKQTGSWPDGQPFGKLRRPAWLQKEYADGLYTGAKALEGRPAGHPVVAHTATNDCIEFGVSGEQNNTMYMRVVEVLRYDTYEEMLTASGVHACNVIRALTHATSHTFLLQAVDYQCAQIYPVVTLT